MVNQPPTLPTLASGITQTGTKDLSEFLSECTWGSVLSCLPSRMAEPVDSVSTTRRPRSDGPEAGLLVIYLFFYLTSAASCQAVGHPHTHPS